MPSFLGMVYTSWRPNTSHYAITVARSIWLETSTGQLLQLITPEKKINVHGWSKEGFLPWQAFSIVQMIPALKWVGGGGRGEWVGEGGMGVCTQHGGVKLHFPF